MDHPLGIAARQSKIGVVFHTHYTGDDLADMQARAGADVTGSREALVIKNDTPMHRVGFSAAELRQFDNHVQKIERMCSLAGDFLDDLVSNMGSTGDKKFHISTYIKQFFNSEVRAGTQITNVDETVNALVNFYDEKMQKELAKIKTVANRTKKCALVYNRTIS